MGADGLWGPREGPHVPGPMRAYEVCYFVIQVNKTLVLLPSSWRPHSRPRDPVETGIRSCHSAASHVPLGSHFTQRKDKSLHNGPQSPPRSDPCPPLTSPASSIILHPPCSIHLDHTGLLAGPRTHQAHTLLWSLAFAVSSAWTSLPPDFLKAPSLIFHKSLLRSHLLTEAYPDCYILISTLQTPHAHIYT